MALRGAALALAAAATLAAAGCSSTGACVVADTDAGAATYPHCDDGVTGDTCSSGGAGAMFVGGKSCKDLGYTLACTVIQPIAPPNCYLGGGPSDAGGTTSEDATASGAGM